MIVIRMARGGRVNAPIFTIVATDSRSPRDGKFLARLGKYNPKLESPLENVNTVEIGKWVKDGAILSDTVKTLLKKHKITIPNK